MEHVSAGRLIHGLGNPLSPKTFVQGMACGVGSVNPPVRADPETRSERGVPGQKCPIMPQLEHSCTELQSKPLRHTPDQTDLLNPSSELLPSLL